jgi:hypothetical protein|eukprot:COSAG01_NODE_625_length_14726_cov_9.023997_2_plen_83_part_00
MQLVVGAVTPDEQIADRRGCMQQGLGVLRPRNLDHLAIASQLRGCVPQRLPGVRHGRQHHLPVCALPVSVASQHFLIRTDVT